MRARRTAFRLPSGPDEGLNVNLLTRIGIDGGLEYSLCRGLSYSPDIDTAMEEAPEHGGWHLIGEYSRMDDPRIGQIRSIQPEAQPQAQPSRKAQPQAQAQPSRMKPVRKAQPSQAQALQALQALQAKAQPRKAQPQPQPQAKARKAQPQAPRLTPREMILQAMAQAQAPKAQAPKARKAQPIPSGPGLGLGWTKAQAKALKAQPQAPKAQPKKGGKKAR